MECESEHTDKNNLIYFRDILPNKNKFKENVNELKIKIEEYKQKINGIKKALDNVVINLEIYYEINDNLIKDFDKKKKNYYLFKNMNELDKNNNIIIQEVNNIIKIDEFSEIINNSINLMNKMNIQYNGKNIVSVRDNNGIVNNTNMIIDNYFSDINLVEDSANIKKLYENFIKKDNNNSQNSSVIYDKSLYIAMLAEQYSNYEDMFYFMKILAQNKKEIMTYDERNLFSIACKNYINVNRTGYRTILAYENKERKKENSPYLSYIIEYKKIVENISYIKFQNILKFIEENIIQKDNFKNYDYERKTFFYKMMGDYNKYLSQYKTFESKCIKEAEKYYNQSLKFSNDLPIYNPVKLGLNLNLAVFYYDILKDRKKAIDLSKSIIKKFDLEAKNLDEEDEEKKDAISIYYLIKENLEDWEKEI